MIGEKRVFVLLILHLLFYQLLLPHSGRTDSQGGHYNRRTGEYHFHHGYPAHNHPNGICPYSSGGSTTPSYTNPGAVGDSRPSIPSYILPGSAVVSRPSTQGGSTTKDNSYIIFLAIASGFVLYYLMKYKNKKKYSNSPHKVLLKDGLEKKSEISMHENKVDNVLCPSCKKGFLLLRHGSYGEFLGCSRFPNCHYTKSVKY